MVMLSVGSLIKSLRLMRWVKVPWSSPIVNKSPDPLKSPSHRRFGLPVLQHSPPSALPGWSYGAILVLPPSHQQ